MLPPGKDEVNGAATANIGNGRGPGTEIGLIGATGFFEYVRSAHPEDPARRSCQAQPISPTSFLQQTDDLLVTPLTRKVQRRLAGPLFHIRVGLVLQEQRDHLWASTDGSSMQWGAAAILTACFRVRRVRQENLGHLHVVARGGEM